MLRNYSIISMFHNAPAYMGYIISESYHWQWVTKHLLI